MMVENSTTTTTDIPFGEFITQFKATIKQLFAEREQNFAAQVQRGFSAEEMAKIMAQTPLSVAIPSAYGGRGAHPRECMSLLEACSYESIPLTLMCGINIALFIEPFAKYGNESIKSRIFGKFLDDKCMGGLMITEPDHGSDALNMKTSYTTLESGDFHLTGTKHWQGLTGLADYWLVAARKMTSKGALSRDVDLFVSEDNIPAQHINVTEYYENYGLYQIPYGRNEIDINLPSTHRLQPETTGIKMLMDTLHRSRLQFPGMALGFLRRALEEATNHCQERMVRGKSLRQFDQIEQLLVRLESSYTICSSMCYTSSHGTSIDFDLALKGIEANTFKAVVSDLMQESAQILTQLLGGKGYLVQSLGSRSIMDSRPFQIFEGPNDMLFTQLADMVLKAMSKAKETNLLSFMKTYELSRRSAELFKADINVNLDRAMPQRKSVIIGEVMAFVIIAHNIMQMRDQGFNSQLAENALIRLQQDVSVRMNSYTNRRDNQPTEGYMEDSSWYALLDKAEV